VFSKALQRGVKDIGRPQWNCLGSFNEKEGAVYSWTGWLLR
jgi:hypothetical protein